MLSGAPGCLGPVGPSGGAALFKCGRVTGTGSRLPSSSTGCCLQGRWPVIPAQSLLDVHVHLASLPAATNCCPLSASILRRPTSRLILRRLSSAPADPEGSSRGYVTRLAGE